MRQSAHLLCAASLLASGCASTPDMTVHYLLPRVDLDLKVVKSVSCDRDGDLFAALSATHDAVYSASSPATDKDAVQAIRLGRLDGFFSDTDLGFDFTEDGRLAGLNVASTGVAGEIVKSAIALVEPLMPGAGPGITANDACAKIAQWGGANKTLTLTYVGTIPFASKDGGQGPLEADASSAVYERDLGGAIGSVCWIAGKSEAREPMGLDPGTAGKGGVALVLRQPAVAKVQIVNYDSPGCQGLPTTVWSGEVPVPQHGKTYVVLIPKAAAFGKQNFTLKLSDAGTVTQLKYGKTNGVAAALDAGGAVEKAAIQTPAERAQRATDEMNAIAAQEKLARCLADRSKCGS